MRPAIVLLALFTLLTGGIYPALVTAAAQVLFPSQANGSMHAHGSSLIGQAFSDPGYFWSRPSATTPTHYKRDGILRLEPGAAEPSVGRSGWRAGKSPARRGSEQ